MARTARARRPEDGPAAAAPAPAPASRAAGATHAAATAAAGPNRAWRRTPSRSDRARAIKVD